MPEKDMPGLGATVLGLPCVPCPQSSWCRWEGSRGSANHRHLAGPQQAAPTCLAALVQPTPPTLPAAATVPASQKAPHLGEAEMVNVFTLHLTEHLQPFHCLIQTPRGLFPF